MIIIAIAITYVMISALVSKLFYEHNKYKNPDFVESILNDQLRDQAKQFGLLWVVTVPIHCLMLFMDLALKDDKKD